MRKLNACVTAAIFILFLVHMIWGIFSMTGLTAGGNKVFSFLAYFMTFLVFVHVLIGCKLTYDTLKAQRLAGVSYFKDNMLFWIRRISGFALLIFMAAHIFVFKGRRENGNFRLNNFDLTALILQILMVLSLLVHVLIGVKPLRLSLGIEDKRDLKTDILIVLSVLLLLSAVAFLVYYIRWQAV